MRNKKLEKLREVILKTISLTQSEIKRTEFDYYDYISTSFLKRHIYILYGLSELLPKYQQNENLIISISPILRMGIADFITQCYLISATEVKENAEFNKTEYEKRVEQIFFSPILKEISRIEKERKSRIISEEKYKIDISNAYKVGKIAFSKFDIETSEYELKIKTDISPAKMFRIASQNKFFKKYESAYSLYDYYSKMEHYGGFSNIINSIEHVNEKVNTDRIIHSVVFIIRGIEFSIENLESKNQTRILAELQNIGKSFIEQPLNKNCW